MSCEVTNELKIFLEVTQVIFWFTLLLVVLADQISKWLVVSNFYLGESIQILGSWLHFTYIINNGAAFGIFAGKMWMFILLSLFIAGGIIYYLFAYRPPWGIQLFTGLIVGGAIGNLIDRLSRTGVVDFIDLGWWPVFNIADSAVCCGAILLLIHSFFQDRKEVRNGTD